MLLLLLLVFDMVEYNHNDLYYEHNLLIVVGATLSWSFLQSRQRIIIIGKKFSTKILPPSESCMPGWGREKRDTLILQQFFNYSPFCAVFTTFCLFCGLQYFFYRIWGTISLLVEKVKIMKK
jgi:hypothetical protein